MSSTTWISWPGLVDYTAMAAYAYMDSFSLQGPAFHSSFSYSVDPGAWDEICACVSDDLRFHRKPKFTAIPLNGHLIQVRHQTVQTKADLHNCLLSDKRV